MNKDTIKKRPTQYFQFPLCLLQKVITGENGFNLIAHFGIVDFAKKINFDLQGVARQLIYDFYRGVMQEDLKNLYEEYIKEEKITNDEDYNGFDADGNFCPEEMIEEVLKLFSTDDYFKRESILHYQIHQAADCLRVNIGSIQSAMNGYNEANRFYKSHKDKYGEDPWPGISKSYLFETRDKNNPQETALFCAVVALRSIIGQKSYNSTHKSVILSRMIGAKRNDVLQELLKKAKFKEVYYRYDKRYHYDKLIREIRARGFLRGYYPDYRKIFISTDLTTDEMLPAIAHNKNKYNFKKIDKENREKLKMLISEGAPI